MDKNFESLQNVIASCIAYVGSANYDSRERHARNVAKKALNDYKNGKEPKWFNEIED